MFSTLMAQEPQSADNFVVQLKMSNQNQIDEFYKSAKPDLMRFLRTELKNDNIMVEVILEENSTTNLIYSPEDKFKHLLSKNPLLGKMRQIYGLDFD